MKWSMIVEAAPSCGRNIFNEKMMKNSLKRFSEHSSMASMIPQMLVDKAIRVFSIYINLVNFLMTGYTSTFLVDAYS
ncbi:hypothetical protein GLYMA_05G027200v4 [Glycine max]|uniref:Uncharacterized protein n=1 Tax=Glycine max TaxID=3847 RepID=K7KMJ1_SOYBN|nr:hypothetical protein GLYMA_05G027200v4 [Glycine max]